MSPDKMAVGFTLLAVLVYFLIRIGMFIAKSSKYPKLAAVKFFLLMASLFTFQIGMTAYLPALVIPAAVVGVIAIETDEDKLGKWLEDKFVKA